MVITKAQYSNDDWLPVFEFLSAMMENPTEILNYICNKSDMTTLTNYPPMARRTKHLRLLYRCIVGGACLERDDCIRMYEHIVRSQYEMARIYNGGGVFPIAVLEQDGVRHTYYYFKKRQTLYDALQPFRMLANDILLTPSQRYAKIVLENVNKTSLENTSFLERAALIMCLVVPLVNSKPAHVKKFMSQIKKEAGDDYAFLTRMTEETLTNLENYR